MRKTRSILSATMLAGLLFSNCVDSAKNTNISDNTTIGKQIWMAKNLNVDKFRNGDPIPEAKTEAEWNQAFINKQPIWCYYEFDPENGEKYGKLYNVYALNDPRELAPEGWRIPTNDDWVKLIDFAGGPRHAGKKLKYTDFWEDYNGKSGNGTNEVGFAGLPGGGVNLARFFSDPGSYGCWWSSTKDRDSNSLYLSIGNGETSGFLFMESCRNSQGNSVRCILNNKESGKTDANSTKLKAVNEVAIGKQIWMSENLNTEKFRNGDPIPEAKTYEEWIQAAKNKQPAFCYYNNNPDNGDRYGKLYNWYAVGDPRGLAPDDWRIPTNDDWNRLIDFLGGPPNAGKKMKHTDFWLEEDNGTNESGFSGLPSGLANMSFDGIGTSSSWWSATEHGGDARSGWSVNLIGRSYAKVAERSKESFISVRCIRN